MKNVLNPTKMVILIFAFAACLWNKKKNHNSPFIRTNDVADQRILKFIG